MIKIILVTTAWVLFLVATSLLFVWLSERSKSKAKEKQRKKFLYFDKYYNELEKESEKNLEQKRKERMVVLGYNKEEINNESGNIEPSITAA